MNNYAVEFYFDNEDMFVAGVIAAFFLWTVFSIFRRLPSGPEKEATISIPAAKITNEALLRETLNNFLADKMFRAGNTSEDFTRFEIVGEDNKSLGKVALEHDARRAKYIVRLIDCRFDITLDLFYFLTDRFAIGELNHTGSLK